jgi:hypothetical protein
MILTNRFSYKCIDEKGQFATASVYGWKNEKRFREGLGAMLVDADFDETTPYDVPKELKLFQS